MRENIVKLITLGLIIVLGFTSYRVFIAPKSSGIKKLQQTMKTIESQINSIFGGEVTLRGGTAQNEEILRQLEKFKQQIPSENDLTAVVDEIITSSGKGLNIDYRLIEPQDLQTEGKYKRLPIRLSFVSDYHGFITYLNQLSQLPVITVIDGLALKRSAEDPSKIDIDLSLSAFLMPAQPGELQKEKKAATAPSLLTNPFLSEAEITGEVSPAQRLSLLLKKAPAIFGKAIAGSGLKLQGTWKGREVRAFINGKTVKAGDKVDGYLVDEIGDKKVVLTKGGKTYTLTLK